MVLDELVKFSNFYGSNPELVLAGGGNTSAKENGIMYVKGSGTKLATIRGEQFVKTDLEKIKEIFLKSYPENDAEREAAVLADLMASRCEGEENKRPSVETMLHAIFEQKYVLHLHPALVNGLTCSKGGKDLAIKLFGEKFIWVDACKPGYILSKICYDKMQEYKACFGIPADMIILQNHGIFIGGNNVQEIDSKLNCVIDVLSSYLSEKPDFTCKDVKSVFAHTIADATGFYVDEISNDYTQSICKCKDNASVILSPFTPDHIVYCKAYPMWLAEGADIKDAFTGYKEKYGFTPRVVVAQGKGIFCCGDNAANVANVRMLFEDAIKIAVYSQSFGGAFHMSEELTDFIVNWEVESYRSKQN